MAKIKRALVSLSDKTGIVEFARDLSKLGIQIISTGGTAKLLKENNIEVTDVSDYTGFPEMLNGRVKTLHPKIHAGILALRDNPEHMDTLKKHNIETIDMVIVNLYPFEEVIKNKDITLDEAIENIDIGGPTMLRSAAKNYKSVAVICNLKRYSSILEELRNNNCSLSEETLEILATDVFALTSTYDSAIYNYLAEAFSLKKETFPERLSLVFKKIQGLRYGENPHQKAAFYSDAGKSEGFANVRQLQGKELSFNNILDLNAAQELVREFKEPAAVIIKHNNPCGVSEAKDIIEAYRNAWDCDRLSAFGGIVGLSRPVDLALAKVIFKSGFLECIIAPQFKKEATKLLSNKKNLRLIEIPDFNARTTEVDLKKISGGLLIQDKDTLGLDANKLKVVTKKKPTKLQLLDLIFAWKVVKHTKSNAIVLAKQRKAVGIGPGQTSRVEAVNIAVRKAAKKARGSVMASDAFFPKSDSIGLAAKAGVKAIIQPGGSISDEEVIKVANKAKIAMVFTGIRHFKH